MTTKHVFFGKLNTIINQFELAAMRKTTGKKLEIYLKNGTKLTAEGEDAKSIWNDWKKATEPGYDPDFDEDEV